MASLGSEAEFNGVRAEKVVIFDKNGVPLNHGRLMGWDSATETWRAVQVVESTTTPGQYVLAVGNIDGSPISGGAVTPTDYSDLLIQDGSFLLLQNGDNLLLQA